jgi:phage/conjugal plasmid C-4 type zinc finger TraR family protein
MKTNKPTHLLKAYQQVVARLRAEGEVPKSEAASRDFLDIAQSVEHQELARLSASRLADRARRLRLALTRAADGEYGACSECGAAIPLKRLRAIPDATTCVACQEQLERVGS